jgi:fructose-1,6-bisphosphatase II
VAVDALEGSGILARGQGGAISVLAVGAPGSIMSVPDMYMQKMSVGASAAGHIDIDVSIEENLQAIARAYRRKVGEIAVIVLDRPRHEDLVEEIRMAGARIKLIPDGDIMASIAAAVRGTGDHAYIGIGGSTEGVMTAAAMRCLGGEIQAKFWPLSRREIESAKEYGIGDIEHTFRTDDMVQGELVFSATGVSTGDVLRGVDYFYEGARSQTLLMCTKCRMVRFVDTIHLFSDDRSEIKLL